MAGATFAPAYGTLLARPLGGGAASSVCTSASGGTACPILAAAYATYLTSHLPEKFFIGCNLLGRDHAFARLVHRRAHILILASSRAPCSARLSAGCANNECLLGDGTSPVGSGLFVRHSVAEMLHGYADPLFAAVPASAVPPGVVLEYNGILGKHQTSTSTLATLRAAIAANSTTAVQWAYECVLMSTNESPSSRMTLYYGESPSLHHITAQVRLRQGRHHQRQQMGLARGRHDYGHQPSGWVRVLTPYALCRPRSSPHLSPLPSGSYPGWGTTGIFGDPFVLPGLRSQNNQAPQTATNRAFSMMAGGNKAPANFGTTIEFYLASVNRAVRHASARLQPLASHAHTSWPLDAGDDRVRQWVRAPRCQGCQCAEVLCAAQSARSDRKRHDQHNMRWHIVVCLRHLPRPQGGCGAASCSVHTPTCVMYSTSSLPAFAHQVGTPVASTCDYMMRHAGVINLEFARGAPAAITMGYLGNTGTSIRDAVSITLPGSTTEIVYDQATDELALFFEPISGRAIKGLERLQTNFYIEKTMLDSTRYANIFSGTTDNGDVFVWPYLYLNRQPGLTQDQADTFVATIYGVRSTS